MRIRFRWKRFIIGWGIVVVLVGIGYLLEGCNSPEAISAPTVQTQSITPTYTPAPVTQAALSSPTPVPPTSTPVPPKSTPIPTPTPAPVELYTPTIEADAYEVSGPSHIVFKVPVADYNFADRHIIGLDDAATKDVRITVKEINGEYIVDISSSDALETPDEDVGVFVGDVEADFCGDPQPVLTVNEPLDGAKWKPTRWYCTPFGGGGDDDIHVFPTVDE